MRARRAVAGPTLAALTGLLAACEIAHVAVSPEGYLEVFGPLAGFEQGRPPPSWVSRNGGADHVRALDAAEAPVLEADASADGYLFVRRTKARLLATPFLSWSWKVERPVGAAHPIRLIVGFYGGDPTSGSRGSQPFAFLGESLPVFDRAIELVWASGDVPRGALPGGGRVPRYAVRGGADLAGDWRQENVDLARIYGRLWPRDDFAEIEIAFVGIASAPGGTGARAQFSDIALSR